MKNIFLSLKVFLGIFLIVFTTACQQQESVTPYYQVIPEEVDGVVAVKVNRILEKAGGDENIISFLALFQKQLDQKVLQQLQEILKNGPEYGLNLSENLYVFSEAAEGQIGIVAKVSEVARTEKALKNLGLTIGTDAKGYRHAVLDKRLVCYFNESVLVCVTTLKGTADIENYAMTLMNLPAEKSLSQKEGFVKLRSSADDISFLKKNQFPGEDYMLSFSEIDVAKVDLLGGINFENGLVKAYYSYFSSDRATADLLAKGYAFLRKEKKNLSDLYPASTLFYFATNLNGPQLAKEIEERDFPELRQNKIAIQQFLSALNGECALGYLNISPMGIPSSLLYAEVDNDYPLEYMIQFVQKEFGNTVQVRKTGNSAYECKVIMLNMDIYAGIKDGLLYITNDNSAYRNIGKKVADPLHRSPFFTHLTHSYIGAFMNVTALLQSPIVQLGLSQWKQGVGALILQFLSECSYLELYQESPEKTVLNISLQNQGQNSLKTLLEAARK